MTTGRTWTPVGPTGRAGTLVSVILIILCHMDLTSSFQGSSTTDGHLATGLQPLLIQIVSTPRLAIKFDLQAQSDPSPSACV